MKNTFLLLILSATFLACGNSYKVKGSISSDVIDGEYVYIKRMSNGVMQTLDSCKVMHGAFEMGGTADSAHVVSLYIGNIPILPFVAERGEIEFEVTDNAIIIGGTPLNDELNTLIREQAVLEARMTELERMETSLILNGSTAEAAADFVSDSIDVVGASMEQLINGYVRRNIDNVLGPCVFALMYSAVPAPIITDELESLYKEAPEAFRNDEFVRSFYEIARENATRLEQQRLLE